MVIGFSDQSPSPANGKANGNGVHLFSINNNGSASTDASSTLMEKSHEESPFAGDNIVLAPLNISPNNERQSVHPRFWCGQHGSSPDESANSKNVYNYAMGVNEKEKTPMCQIAELARFHKLKHEYQLLDESGPAHKKLFTVQLVLTPTEIYEGSGASIKKAQQAAADSALRETILTRPQPKKENKRRRDPSSPCVLLSHVARRLNLPEPVYTIQPFPLPHPHLAPLSPLQFSPGGFPTPPPPIPNFVCCLLVAPGQPPVSGLGLTKMEARFMAAKQALFLLGPTLSALEHKVKTESAESKLAEAETERTTHEEEGSKSLEVRTRFKPKSVISQVHECALLMKLTVEFEVLSEDGRAHERVYIVRCRLIGGPHQFQADGEGKKKKDAKTAACAKLVETLESIESSPLYIASTLFKSEKKSFIPSRENKRKTIVKDMKMDPSYGHQINPVSRLIQVLQARGEPDAKFEHLGETGQYKYRQFLVQVTCGDLCTEGAGPNKRLAKRAAAESMLVLMGVAKPLPEPKGKGLLKKREDDCFGAMANIGVFDPSELPPLPPPPAPLPPPPPPPPSQTTIESSSSLSDTREIKWSDSSRDSPVPSASPDNSSRKEEKEKERRRRVTFNSQVAACPAPDDVSYPSTEVAPLKTEDLGGGGNKVRRRGKEGRARHLTTPQKEELGKAALAWCQNRSETEDNVFRIESLSEPPFDRGPARAKLEKMGTTYRFTVHYTVLPQGGGDGGSGRTMDYFALVTLGFDKPIIINGSGESIEAAHENSAANALHQLANEYNKGNAPVHWERDDSSLESSMFFSPQPPTHSMDGFPPIGTFSPPSTSTHPPPSYPRHHLSAHGGIPYPPPSHFRPGPLSPRMQ